jgi:protocatechuate 3,4-dioxygenase beta subunit
VGLTRRRLLELGIVLPLRFIAGRWVAEADALAPTPSCDDDPTASNALGPFFKPRSPRRGKLRRPGVRGVPLVLTGTVLSTSCRPIPGALLDFWQADGRGRYDNAGFRLRGHQFTDRHGRYRLETVLPGLYPGRTRHIHVRARAPGGPVLTTQLFFPGVARNETDFLFDSRLLVKPLRGHGRRRVRFDFILTMSEFTEPGKIRIR